MLELDKRGLLKARAVVMDKYVRDVRLTDEYLVPKTQECLQKQISLSRDKNMHRLLATAYKLRILVREFQFNVLAGRGRHFTVWFYGFVGLWGCGVRSRQ